MVLTGHEQSGDSREGRTDPRNWELIWGMSFSALCQHPGGVHEDTVLRQPERVSWPIESENLPRAPMKGAVRFNDPMVLPRTLVQMS